MIMNHQIWDQNGGITFSQTQWSHFPMVKNDIFIHFLSHVFFVPIFNAKSRRLRCRPLCNDGDEQLLD